MYIITFGVYNMYIWNHQPVKLQVSHGHAIPKPHSASQQAKPSVPWEGPKVLEEEWFLRAAAGCEKHFAMEAMPHL
jgi:hypothetical protein